jgi:hypothetical protein
MQQRASCEVYVQLAKKFPAIQGIWRLITELEGATVPYPQLSKYNPHALFSHLRLGLKSDLFLSLFRTKMLYARLISPVLAICPAFLILLDLDILIIFGEKHKR